VPRKLSLGCIGDDVAAVQRLLNYHLPAPKFAPLVVDKKFGNLTRTRVIEFQQLNRLYPTKMPIEQVDGVEPKPLVIDGEVGPNTGRVLLDVREVSQHPTSRLVPNEKAKDARRSRLRVRDGPAPAPPHQLVRSVSLQAGGQASVNPWVISPFVLTGQFTWLARNDGKPDLLLTAGGQFSANLGDTNGSWSGQIFGQMALGNLKLQLGPLDFLNPFVQTMLQKNQGQPPAVGLAVGNQVNLSLKKVTVGGIEQDSLGLFVNLQEVVSVGLDSGNCTAPATQGMLGLGWSFLFF